MYICPDLPRLARLDLSGFDLDERLVFCPKCPWQAHEAQVMKPECPDCGARLHVLAVNQDTLEAVLLAQIALESKP